MARGLAYLKTSSHNAYGVLVPWERIFKTLNLKIPPSDTKRARENWKKTRFPKRALMEALQKYRGDLFQEYYVYNVANAFALFSPNKIKTTRMGLYQPGAGSARNRKLSVSVAPVNGCSFYCPLLELAKAFGQQPKFLPGAVSITSSCAKTFDVRLMFKKEPYRKNSSLDERIPRDITITDGTDSFEHNQDILIHYGLGDYVSEASKNNGVLDLSGKPFSLLEAEEAVEKQTHRRLPTDGGSNRAKGKQVYSNSTRQTYLTIKQQGGEPKQDCTFVVGRDESKETIKANRAVLAHASPVLADMLYGTELIKVNPKKPIIWDDFNPLAVKLVFQALTNNTNHTPTVVESNTRSAFLQVLDFLGESEDSVLWEDGDARKALDNVQLKFEYACYPSTCDWMIAPNGVMRDHYKSLEDDE